MIYSDDDYCVTVQWFTASTHCFVTTVEIQAVHPTTQKDCIVTCQGLWRYSVGRLDLRLNQEPKFKKLQVIAVLSPISSAMSVVDVIAFGYLL